MLISIILLIIFWIKGIKFIKVIIYKNIPTKEKLKELLKRKKKYSTQRRIKKKNKSKNNQKNKNNDKSLNKDNNENNNSIFNNYPKINLRKEIKYETVAGTHLLKNNNPPPKYSNILKLNEYIKYKKGQKKNRRRK